MNMRTLLFPTFLLLTALSLLVVSCKKDDDTTVVVPPPVKLVAEYSAEPSLKWNQMFLEIERFAAGYRPGPAPRALAYMGLAAYEACIAGMPNYNSLKSNYPGLTLPEVQQGLEYHWPTVVHAVYTNMMPRFFTNPPATEAARMNTLIAELNNKYLTIVGQEIFDRSKAYGEAVGSAMWEWSTTDPYGHDAYKDPFGNFTTNETYNWEDHYTGPGKWRPTFPGPGKPMGPYFGKARRFAITSEERLSLPPSHYYMSYSEDPSSKYYSSAIDVYTKMAAQDFSVKWIGEFWSDDLLDLTFSPGPRWTAVANQVIKHENSSLETALEAYAKVGMALNDAAVACWHSKFHYNIERPDTYIKKVIDPNYKPNLNNPLTGDLGVTPSFPAFPSGHSTMGAAGAEALASVFGYAYGMTDRCHEGRTEFEGAPRAFGSFYEMALENAFSRVLLGVHWQMDCDEGMRHGTVIGRKVNRLQWKK